MDVEKTKKVVDDQLTQAEDAKPESYSDEMAQLRAEFEKTYGNYLSLTEEQQRWVDKQLEAAKQQTKILKGFERKGEDNYEDFTEEDKEMMMPDIRLGLLLNARGNADANVRAFLRGKYYSLVKDTMDKYKLRRFRGFIALTEFTPTSVYQDIKIAENYSLDDIRAAHGIKKKTLYTVAVKRGDGAADALREHHEVLTRAKTPDEVKRTLDPNYEPPRKQTPQSAISSDGTIKAEFFEPGTKGRGRIVIVPTDGNVGVSDEYWGVFQTWFADPASWTRFTAWKNHRDEEADWTEDGDEEVPDEAVTDEASEPTLAETVQSHQEIWADETFTHADSGSVNAKSYLGLDNGDSMDETLYGDLFVKFVDEHGVEQVVRETLVGPRFPTTGNELDQLRQRVSQEHPKPVYAGISRQDEFYVGVKWVEGTPATRWNNGIR